MKQLNEYPTPLTDATESHGFDEWGGDATLVSSDFARDLERKLAQMTEERDALKEGIDLVDKVLRNVQIERDRLRTYMAAQVNEVDAYLGVCTELAEVKAKLAMCRKALSDLKTKAENVREFDAMLDAALERARKTLAATEQSK